MLGYRIARINIVGQWVTTYNLRIFVWSDVNGFSYDDREDWKGLEQYNVYVFRLDNL